MSFRTSSPSVVSTALAKDRLGMFAVIMFALTAATPLLVVSGLVVTGWAVFGISGLPLGFVVLGIVLAIFSAGYVAMARHVTNAGAFYSYIARGTSKTFGVGASMIAVLAYNMLQVGIYGIFGVVGSALLAQKAHWDVSWWVVALLGWALVGLLGALRVDISSKVIGLLLLLEVVSVVIFDITELRHPAGGSVSFAAFEPKNLFVPGVGAAFALVITAFVGFEAAPVFSEEARHARRTVPAATYLGLAAMGLVYTVTSWSVTVTLGVDKIASAARSDPNGLYFDTAAKYLGTGVIDLGNLLLLTSLLAGAVSYHNSVARYTFALGRERVLPRTFGRTRARTGAPVAASLVQTTVGLATIVLYAIAGWDPLTRLFFWLGTTGGFGILILLIGTSISVIAFFSRGNQGESIWSRLLAPMLATAGLAYVLWQTVIAFPDLLGVQSNSPFAWLLPGLYAFAFAVGIARALILKSSKPDVYQAIGLGAQASTGIPAADARTIFAEVPSL